MIPLHWIKVGIDLVYCNQTRGPKVQKCMFLLFAQEFDFNEKFTKMKSLGKHIQENA
jgi:hypothetical protein